MQINPAKDGQPAMAQPCETKKANSATRSTGFSFREATVLARKLDTTSVISIKAALPRGKCREVSAPI